MKTQLVIVSQLVSCLKSSCLSVSVLSQVALKATIRALLNNLNAAKATIKRQHDAIQQHKAHRGQGTASPPERETPEVVAQGSASSSSCADRLDGDLMALD